MGRNLSEEPRKQWQGGSDKSYFGRYDGMSEGGVLFDRCCHFLGSGIADRDGVRPQRS